MSKEAQEGGKERKSNAGRKSKYHTHIEPYLDSIAAMARTGVTLEQIAEKFGVAYGTLFEYKNKFPEFRDILRTNADIADFAVENALYKNAMDGNLTAQIFWLKNRQARRWRDKQHVFSTSTTTVRKDYESMTDDELDREMEAYDKIVPGEEDEEEIETDGEVH